MKEFAQRKIALIVCFVLLFGCQTSRLRNDDNQQLKAYGPKVKVLGRSIDPAIVKLTMPNVANNHCTGTFVSDSVVLTAAHCTEEHQVLTLPEFGGLQSQAVHTYPPGLIGTAWEESPNDIALVVFAQGTSTRFMPIAYRHAKVGDTARLIGYGSCEKFLGPKSTHGRCGGDTTVMEIRRDTRIRTQTSDGIGITKGDSGGPMIIGNRVAGVANSATPDGKFADHTDVLNLKNLAWLRQVANEHQLRICGLDGLECTSQQSPRTEPGREPSVGNPSSAPIEIEKSPEELIAELINEMSKHSSCTFRIKGEFQRVEMGSRVAVSIAARDTRGRTLNATEINFDPLEYVHGRELFLRLEERGYLALGFPHCQF